MNEKHDKNSIECAKNAKEKTEKKLEKSAIYKESACNFFFFKQKKKKKMETEARRNETPILMQAKRKLEF